MSVFSDKTRRRIFEQAGNRCGYCLGEQKYVYAPLEIDHILPTAEGGTDDEVNLWLACGLCNSHKSTKTHGVDKTSKRKVKLFNPRKQNWKRHFYVENGIEIVGKTAVGRVTVEALRLNSRIAITVRKNWLIAGWYPPED
jgi:hypothetical protein